MLESSPGSLFCMANFTERASLVEKSKSFSVALDHCNEIIELDPKNCTCCAGVGTVRFERGEYVRCIMVCNKTVEVGRENRANSKLISKAYSRAENAYLKLDDLISAKKHFENLYRKTVFQTLLKN